MCYLEKENVQARLKRCLWVVVVVVVVGFFKSKRKSPSERSDFDINNDGLFQESF